MTAQRGFADVSIKKTYRRLRILISVVLIVLPIMTAVSAWLIGDHHWQPSLSDYYFVVQDGGLPRTIFLVFLAFIGCILFAYRGLDKLDDRIHNLAGLFAFGEALFPMTCDKLSHPYCVPGLWPMFHLPSAVLLYLCAVGSVFYGGGLCLLQRESELALRSD